MVGQLPQGEGEGYPPRAWRGGGRWGAGSAGTLWARCCRMGGRVGEVPAVTHWS